MRKLDKFILQSFIGPFLLATGLATFILLIQYMMKYFDDFVGKNLGFEVFGKLLFFFSLNMLQIALPLGVLVSSLMTFGNLGEQFELSAIKSAGISLIRALRPIFFFVVLLAYAAFNFNNYIVPVTNLEAYSLLYDIKHKKAALNITAGVFYNEIPDYSIYVKEKYKDDKTLKDVMIYDHTAANGNKRVILADSSLMYTIIGDKYLKLELYNGNYFIEEEEKNNQVDQLFRTKFKRMDMVFDLASFDLQETTKELFQNNRQMKNIAMLSKDIDSLSREYSDVVGMLVVSVTPSYKYALLDREKALRDRYVKKLTNVTPIDDPTEVANENIDNSSRSIQPISRMNKIEQSSQSEIRGIKQMGIDSPPSRNFENSISEYIECELMEDSLAIDSEDCENALATLSIIENPMDTMGWKQLYAAQKSREEDVLLFAKNNAQNIKVNLGSSDSRIYTLRREISKYTIELHKKYSQAVACIIMFLIGAPLGAIIKKGGLGVPVIISIFFFLTYYVIGIMCAKWADQGLMEPIVAAWLANVLLLPFGLFFLRQARIDARLFEVDFYHIWIDKMKTRFLKR
jgi:lipopolysaccharide export system permease protein